MQGENGINVNETINKLRKGKNISKLKQYYKHIIVFILIIINSFLFYYFYLTPEVQAKRCVNNYLEAIKIGKETSEYKMSYIDDFINVLDYKYLDVKKVTNDNKNTTVYFKSEWEKIIKTTSYYENWTEFKDITIKNYTKNGTFPDGLINNRDQYFENSKGKYKITGEKVL